MVFTDLGQHFETVYIRYADIGYDEIYGVLLYDCESCVAVLGHIGGIPAVLDIAVQSAAYDCLVIYDQDIHRSDSIPAHSLSQVDEK